MPGQRDNTLSSLSQGWYMDVEDAQSVVEIFPKLPLPYHLFEVSVRCGDHPYVYLNGCVAPQSLKSFLLEETEDFRLQPWAHLADLIEKDGASSCLLDTSCSGFYRSGEGTSLMAEKFTL